MTVGPKQIMSIAAHAHRARTRCAAFFSQPGLQDPRIIKPGYLESLSRPPCLLSRVARAGQAEKGQESDPTIFPIQLLSGGGRERRMPLKSTEDSANAVGIAPMACRWT